MSKSQGHGKVFENRILDSLGIASEPVQDAIFDIPLIVTSKCAGSIKMSARSSKKEVVEATLGLSDAGRIWAWGDLLNLQAPSNPDPPKIRMIVGVYEQENSCKLIRNVFDITLILNATTVASLYGDLTLNDIYAFHMGMRREFFPDHRDAQAWAKQTKAELSKKGGRIQLNPKIDSKSQRRLQCSILLTDLIAIAHKVDSWSESYLGIELPLMIEGDARERKKRGFLNIVCDSLTQQDIGSPESELPSSSGPFPPPESAHPSPAQ